LYRDARTDEVPISRARTTIRGFYETAQVSHMTSSGGQMVKIVGILLIVLGVIALAYGGISYTKREKVVDIGPIEATAETRETIPLPPILGGLALAGGVILLIYGSRTRT
jgi:hypothetical protein